MTPSRTRLRALLCTATFAALAAPAAIAAESLGCGPSPCVVKDRLVSSDGFPRVSVAVHRPSAMLAVSSRLMACKSRSAVHTSTDEGASWAAHCLPSVKQHYLSDAPHLAFDEQGTLFAATALDAWEDGTYPGMHRSADGGATWRKLEVGSPGYGRYGRGKGMRVKVDTSPDSPFRGSVYATMAVSTVEYTEAHVFFTASRDGGDTWQRSAASPYDQEVGRMKHADLAIDRQGRLYLSYVQCQAWGVNDCAGSSADLMLSTSQDGGATWEPRGKIATIANSGNAPVLAVDATSGPAGGTLYSVRSTLIEGQMRVVVSASTDGGRTWGSEVPVDAERRGSQLTPAAVVADDGVLAVSWIERHADQPGRAQRPMMALSSDGGASFSDPSQLAKQRNSRSDFYQGDGNDLAASGNRLHAAYALHDKDAKIGVHLGGLKR